MKSGNSAKAYGIVRKLNVGFGISFVILVAGIILAVYSLKMLLNRTEWVNHTNIVLLKLENIISVLKDAETGQRGYLLTENPDFLEPYIGSYNKVFQNFKEVKELTIDNSIQQIRLDTLKLLIYKRFNHINKTIELQKSGKGKIAKDMITQQTGKRIMDSIRMVVNTMIKEELDLRNLRIAAVRTSINITPVLILIVSFMSLVIAVVVYFVLKKDVKRRLKAEADLEETHSKLENSYEELRSQGEQLKEFNLSLENMVEQRTEEVKNRNLEIQKINEDIDNIVYSASHDLKSPIANLEGLLLGIKEEVKVHSSTQMEEMLKMMDRSLEKLKVTINDLNNVAYTRKILEDKATQVRIADLIEEFRILHRIEIEQTKATISTDLQVTEVFYSKENLRRILNQLLTNSIKYRSPERNPQIVITTEPTGGGVLLSVKDNGIGFNPEQKEKIFGLFKRAHDHIESSGIGLYIVKRIVESNQGKIEVQAEVGKGTTFTIFLKSK